MWNKQLYRASALVVILGILVVVGAAIWTAPATAGTRPASAIAQAEPTATPAPTAAQEGRRERVEAPPLRPQAAGLLIGINLLIAVAVVVFAFVLRRRQQRR